MKWKRGIIHESEKKNDGNAIKGKIHQVQICRILYSQAIPLCFYQQKESKHFSRALLLIYIIRTLDINWRTNRLFIRWQNGNDGIMVWWNINLITETQLVDWLSGSSMCNTMDLCVHFTIFRHLFSFRLWFHCFFFPVLVVFGFMARTISILFYMIFYRMPPKKPNRTKPNEMI